MKFKRRDLARMFAERGFTKGVEIGVMQGAYSKTLCEENPNLTLSSIDPYKALYNEPETIGWGDDGLEKRFKDATKLLSSYNCEIIRKTSLEAVREFPYEYLDFVYIDGSHEFDYVMCDIIEWGKRVRKGGIISGHDYCKSYQDVIDAVDIYVKIHGAKLHLTDENTPSWWFERTW